MVDKLPDFSELTVDTDGVDVGAPTGRVVVVTMVVTGATVVVVAATVVVGAEPIEYCWT